MIDSAERHFRSGAFPAELEFEHAATHIALLLAWLAYQHMLSEARESADGEALIRLRLRDVTPRQLLLIAFDGRLEEDDLSSDGREFCAWYFDSGTFHRDYDETLAAGLASRYHVEDGWPSYDRLAPVITRRYLEWRRFGPKRWWQFWRR